MTSDTIEKSTTEFAHCVVSEDRKTVSFSNFASVVQERWAATSRGYKLGKRTSQFSDQTPSSESLDSILNNPYIEKAALRLIAFASYQEDWNGEGASAPESSSLRAAGNFLKRLEPWHPRPIAALTSEGSVVLEFYDDESDAFWGSITFVEDEKVEVYVSSDIIPTGNFIEGSLKNADVLRLLSNGLQITLTP
ncbi:hypothetical protein [Agrobacterium pusense]|uniref:hypothetical protein n=1 Tax=Agrobacterium pusense TaxID=648995 RepID=UPI002448AD00|nr:hypothetical protein [Agrobacterium pusense]MDH0873648.1 hypothetical protein [Agrobacterium pusense]MDH1270635.1 hypothetical protein [Agrobacterium pusense]